MANKGNQKLKLLYIMDILREYTDENHPMTAASLIEKLAEKGIEAERKSIYRDLHVLQEYGLEIMQASERGAYYLESGEFELPELKLLVDAVAASKFISEKKSRDLVAKIEGLGNVYQQRHLHRQVVVADRVKSNNEKIYYAIDEIYQCIDENRQLSFQYADWGVDKELKLRHEGRLYHVSPVFLLWDNENYYLVAYDEDAKGIRHYRVDKIVNAHETEETRNPECFKIEQENYAKKRFSMFAGEEKTVGLLAEPQIVGTLLDRFGTDIYLRQVGSMVKARVDVEVSQQFFGWLTGLGGKVTIESPADVREEYKAYLKKVLSQY